MGADYMTMPFDKLFHTVFTDDGDVRACGRDVCIAFMKRMEQMTGLYGWYGNVDTGYLYMPDAYLEGLRLCDR